MEEEVVLHELNIYSSIHLNRHLYLFTAAKAMTPQTPVYSDFANDPDLEYVIADYVMKHLPQRIAAVEECVKSSDWDALEGEIHRLKGSSECHGFTEVSARAEEVESACQEQLFEEKLLGLTAELAALCRRVRVGGPKYEQAV